MTALPGVVFRLVGSAGNGVDVRGYQMITAPSVEHIRQLKNSGAQRRHLHTLLGINLTPSVKCEGDVKAPKASSIHEGADNQFSATAPSLGRSSERTSDL